MFFGPKEAILQYGDIDDYDDIMFLLKLNRSYERMLYVPLAREVSRK
jgi:hypothetical protein